MVKQELTHGCEVLADFRWHDVERATQGKHWVHIFNMRIKREGTVTTNAVIRRQFFHIDDHSDEVAQSSLMEHRTLRFARRAGSIDHISKTIWIRQINRLGFRHIHHKVIDEEGLGSCSVEIAFSLFGLQYLMCGNQHLRFRVFQHIAQSLVRIFKVEWGIGGTCLVDG